MADKTLAKYPCTFCNRIFAYRKSWLGHQSSVHSHCAVNMITSIAPVPTTFHDQEAFYHELSASVSPLEIIGLPDVVLPEELVSNTRQPSMESMPMYAGLAVATSSVTESVSRTLANELFSEVFGDDESSGESDLFAYFEQPPSSPSPPDLISQIFENDVLPGWLSDQMEASEMLTALRALPVSEVATPTRFFSEFQDRYTISAAFLRALILAFHDVEVQSVPPVLEAEPRPLLTVRPSAFDLTRP